MLCERVQAQFSDYSVKRLLWWRARRVEAHLAQCPHCQREWHRFQQVLSALKVVPEQEPPMDLWLGVQQRLRQREALQPTRSWSRVRVSPRLAYAGALTALFVFGVAAFNGYLGRSASPPIASSSLGSSAFNPPFQPLFQGATSPSSSSRRAPAHFVNHWTVRDIERAAKVSPQQPRTVPDGYKFDGYHLYRCNCCPCGGYAALLRYVNGTNRLYVLESRPDHADCADPSHEDRATFGNPCLLCRLGNGSLVETQLPSMRVAVIGNLTQQNLQKVANSVQSK
jgi:hypothetical protein